MSSLRSISKVCMFGIRTPNLDWHSINSYLELRPQCQIINLVGKHLRVPQAYINEKCRKLKNNISISQEQSEAHSCKCIYPMSTSVLAWLWKLIWRTAVFRGITLRFSYTIRESQAQYRCPIDSLNGSPGRSYRSRTAKWSHSSPEDE
jgi:hypothetical protein